MNPSTRPFSFTTHLKSVLRWLTAAPQASSTAIGVPATTLRSQLIHSSPNDRPPARSRPLRVLQVMESGQSGRNPGRLRISGRMADVCAELDRLAAREALQS